jgi:hypothetical protein
LVTAPHALQVVLFVIVEFALIQLKNTPQNHQIIITICVHQVTFLILKQVNVSFAQQNASHAHLLQCVPVVMITSIYFSTENAMKNLHAKSLGQWVKMNILQLANPALKIVIHAIKILGNAHLVNLGFIYLRTTLV